MTKFVQISIGQDSTEVWKDALFTAENVNEESPLHISHLDVWHLYLQLKHLYSEFYNDLCLDYFQGLIKETNELLSETTILLFMSLNELYPMQEPPK